MKTGLLEEGQFANDHHGGHDVTIDLIDVSYAVMGANKKPKRLLKNVNLSFKAGTMCALMGPSGAGKSTLLDFVADRKLEGIYAGEVMIDGKPRTDHFRLRTAYVLQDDVHIATLTVEEILYFSVWTRVPEAKTKEQIQTRVDQLLHMLGIEHIRKSIVGDSLHKGISGGQMKRLSIAVELCCLPDVIFLDEPTSGLDSSISLEVMSAVRNVTGDHRLCVSTIHQPSPDVFGLFNKLVIMCAGRLVWHGHPMEAVTHFSSLGYRYVTGTNPAEFVIAVGGGTQAPEGVSKPRTPAELEFLYKCSRYYQPPALTAKDRFSESTDKRGADDENDIPVHTTVLTQTHMLLSRTWLAKIRDWPDVRAQLLKNVLIGVLIGIVFSGQGDASSPLYNLYGQPNAEVTNVSSLLFFSLMFTLVGNMQAIPYLASQMIIYRRELAANAYVTFPFWVAQSVTTLPLMILNNFLFVIFLYFQVKFPSTASYFFYYLFILLFANVISFYSAMWLAAATGHEQVAFALFPLMFLFTANFSGFAITVNSVPPFWSFGPYLSYGRWLYQGLMVNEWEMFDTDDNPISTNNGNVLAEYDFTGFDKNDSFWIGLLYIMGFSLMTYYSMLPPKKHLQKSGSRPTNVLQESTRSFDTFAMVGGGTNAVDGFRKSSIVNAVSVVAVGDSFRASSFAGGVAGVAGSTFGHGPTGRANDFRSNSIVGGVAAVRSLRSIQRRDSFDDAASDSDEEIDPSTGLSKSNKPSKPAKAPLTVDFYRRSTGLVDQSEGCLLTFKNVIYEVPNREFSRSKAPGPTNRESLRLLNDVTGTVHPGQMCAFMGASGAGKSTLLDVLAQRKNTGRILGDILYNGSTHLKSWAYVMQDNVHVGLLSVRQNLYFAAQLRLPEHWELDKKEKRVDKILDMLGLTEVANTVVGTATLRGISGGQLKRLSIGVEIVHMPNLMFLDEPTTGLDSHISFEVMAAVRNLANQNRTVLCTIHQPSADTFNLFDTVLLMAKGRVIYFGRVHDCVAYFNQSPFAFPYKANSNVADYIIAVGGGFLSAVDGRKVTGDELAEYYSNQQQHQAPTMVFSPDATHAAMANPMLLGNTSGIKPAVTETVKTKDQEETEALALMQYNTSTLHQLKTLCHRLVLKTSRDRRATVVATIRHIIVGIFYGSLYFQLQTGTSPSDYTNRLGLFFFTIMFLVIGHQQSIPAIMDDRLIFYRERGSKAYGAFSYWLSLWAVQLPLVIINAFIYTLIVFFMVGLENGAHTLSFFLYFIIVTSCTGYFIANLMAAISPSTQAALSFYPIVLFINVSFSGFLVYIPRFPSWLGSWAPYISFMRYAFQGMTLAEFQNNDNLPGGPTYISSLGFDSLTIDACGGVLFVWLVFFMLTFLAALKFFDFEQR
jgi:ATP-binding cassette subfamily G (WHITE) protein 2